LSGEPDTTPRRRAPGHWLTAGLFLCLGLVLVGNWTSPKWIVVTLLCYSIPALGQLVSSNAVRIYSLWFGVFLILQGLMSPLIIDRSFVTLQPGLNTQIDVVGDALPGIRGLQTITTDEMGFRVTRDIDYREKPANTFRIFAIGGSTTEQILLDDEKTWTHLAQELLASRLSGKDVEVINTGVSGLRAHHHLATLRKITEYSPDLAIFLMGVNDWNRHIWEVQGAPPPDASVPKWYHFNQSLLGATLRGLYTQFQGPAVLAVREEAGQYYSKQNDSLNRAEVRQFVPESVSSEYRQTVTEIAKYCKTIDIACMFVSQPTSYANDAVEAVRSHYWMTPPNTTYTLDLSSMVSIAGRYNRFLEEVAVSNGLANCDVASRLEPTLDYFYDDCHFNELGASKVAAHIADCIVETVAGIDARP
jgi:lysophospholipase L1-like esterase